MSALDHPDFMRLVQWLTREVLVGELTDNMQHTAAEARAMVARVEAKPPNLPYAQMTRLDHRYGDVRWLLVGALDELDKHGVLNHERALEVPRGS